ELSSLFGNQAQAAADLLTSQGYFSKLGTVYASKETKNPAYTISLRGHSQELLMYTEEGERLEEIGSDQAIAECYPGAIYLSQGESYRVTNLDLSQMRVDLQRHEGSYYTKPIGTKELTILDATLLQRQLSHATLFTGRVHVIDHVTGYVHFDKHS